MNRDKNPYLDRPIQNLPMSSEELNMLLNKRGTQQKFLVNKLGVSKGLVSQWCAGTVSIPEKYHTQIRSLLK